MFGNLFDDVKWYHWIWLGPIVLAYAIWECIPQRRK